MTPAAMIRELRIRNLAIIEQLRLEFEPGLNILTGETGAGKSIILGALRLILGDRSAAEDVRTGEEFAEAEALIDGPLSAGVLQLLAEAGLNAEEDGMVLRREVSANGKSKAVINGRLAPALQLKAVGDLLVDLHGQHQHQSLLSQENHLEALDAFADNASTLAMFAERLREWQIARSALRNLQGDERALEREKDTLEFQVREIDQAELRAGEEESLAAERQRLRNSEQLREAAARAYAMLAEGEADAPTARDLIATAQGHIAEIARLDESQTQMLETLSEMRFRMDDIAERLRDYAESLESDPSRLQAVEERLDLIRNLKRKYGGSIAEILETVERYRERLGSLTNRSDEIARLEQMVAQKESELADASAALSAKRQKAARALEKHMEKELAALQMERAQFRVAFSLSPAQSDSGLLYQGQRVVVGERGVDAVEFQLSANQGESLKPLRKIASGGELSRIMLAMKSILAERDAIPTLIFDEIDTGISGATAQVVGEKMKRLAQTHQVICITHLPQIAVRASRHFAVEKTARGRRMVTNVRVLSHEERVQEIARLLGGDASSAAGLKHAEEMLRKHQEGPLD